MIIPINIEKDHLPQLPRIEFLVRSTDVPLEDRKSTRLNSSHI